MGNGNESNHEHEDKKALQRRIQKERTGDAGHSHSLANHQETGHFPYRFFSLEKASRTEIRQEQAKT